MEWPSCGEIDIMEYYRIQGIPHILANAAWGTDARYHAMWNSKKIPFDYFLQKDKEWASGGKSGFKAYLQALYANIEEDYLDRKYATYDPDPNDH